MVIGLNFELALSLDFEHGYARAITLSSLPLEDLTLTPIQFAEGTYAIPLDYDSALDCSLSRSLCIANLFAIYDDDNTENKISTLAYPNTKLARELSISLSRPPAFDPKLKQALLNLKSQLPEPYENERTESWWRTNSQAWTEKLRNIMIKYRNLGQDWQLSNEQKQLLKQYYDANKLITDCLNKNCLVSNFVREQIEQELLLPIS
ncbi:NACHT C-terminal helical domain 2-containing protein [Nostoc sp.]